MKQPMQSLLEVSMEEPARSAKGKLISERHGKLLFESDKPDLAIQEFSTNGLEEGKKRARSRDVNALRNEISCYLFEYLEGFRIPTHFVEGLSDTQMLVRRTETIHLMIKIYNCATGLLTKRFGMKEGAPLEFPVMEHFYLPENRPAAWVNEYHVYAFGIVKAEEFKQINRAASKVNAVLRALCDRRQLMLAELELEFGRLKGQVVLGNELSPSTCRFLDLAASEKEARDRFHPDQENAVAAFSELRDRLKSRV
jgi:phosphoribosylaminoimidazole-succinocarboxamide synthase